MVSYYVEKFNFALFMYMYHDSGKIEIKLLLGFTRQALLDE